MRVLLPFLLSGLVLLAGSGKKPIGEAGNDVVDIYATALVDRDAIRSALGADLPEGIIAVEVRVVPKGDSPLSISRDDFEIISHKDGQRSGPFVASQIAGSAKLVISSSAVGGGMYSGNPNGPIWGGIPGTMGRPRQLGDPDGGVVGSGASAETETKATQSNDAKDADKDKNNPLIAALNRKMMPEKETKDPVSGLLYFPLEGKKIKLKDIELIYKGPAGRMIVSFAN
jgi:hypothetical protein